MKKILICEDEQDVRESLKNIMQGKDYTVYAAKDGEQALQMAKEISPDLMILDIRMPKIDGLEVARETRKFNTKTKIIFITAFQSPELATEAKKHDIVTYLVKPVSSQDILKVVDEALS